MNRVTLSYVYFAFVALVIVFIDALTYQADTKRPDQVVVVTFLILAVAALCFGDVRLDRGRLNLSGVVIGAAAILLNPLNATLVGLAIAIPRPSRGAWPIVGNGVLTAAYACIGAAVAMQLRTDGMLSLGGRVLVLLLVSGIGPIGVALGLSIRTGESIASIVHHNFRPTFYLAYAYFGLASLLISYVLNGTPLGFLLATIVCVLALALTDTIAGRRVRRVLESELSDADRHLFHSRAVEGVVHNLRNHMANAVGYLREIDPRRLDPVDRESLETATAAATDAVTVLRDLSQDATPRVQFATGPVDLNDLVSRAMGMARPRARTKEVQLAVRETPDVVNVRADPLLMREVITNLLNTAIDAVGQGGRVEATTGKRGNGWPYLSIADNGPASSADPL